MYRRAPAARDVLAAAAVGPRGDPPRVTKAASPPKAPARPRRAAHRPRFDWWGFLLLCAIYVVVALLWHTPWVLPLKCFVVLLHELSHGLAALATGGRILEIHVGEDEGGYSKTLGGSPFAIVFAGYLGSLVLGATLLLVGTRTTLSRYVAALCGTVVTLVALRYMPEGSYGRGFAAASGVVLAAIALFPAFVAETALRVIGVTSCLYAIVDIKHDVLDRDHPASDAAQLEQLTRVPAFLWGLLWIGVSLVVTVVAAKWAVTGGKRPPR